jgi:AcrR family transcriptional regulator
MPSQEKSHERIRQKERTRMELLRAAGELAEKGLQPSVAEVADHAGISRATAYRYFSRPEDLLREAVLDAISRAIEPRVAKIEGGSGDAPEALVDLVRQVHAMVFENEAMFRALLASSMTEKDGKRGARRVGWLDQVLMPLKPRLPPVLYRRLVHALSLLTGIETLVVHKDVCGLSRAESLDVTLWAARTLLEGAIAEAAGGAASEGSG